MKNIISKRFIVIALVLVCVFALTIVLMAANWFGSSSDPDAAVVDPPDLASEEQPVSPPSIDEPEDGDASTGLVSDTDADTGDEPDHEPTDVEDEPDPPEPPPEVPVVSYITSLPVRVIIPNLSLDYEIRSMGADRRGNMEVAPFLAVTSWFNRSPIPGNRGNAILAGHNAWRVERSRLFTLDTLRVGDYMEIEYADGSSLSFRLESVFVYPLLTAPAELIMDVGGESRVTLITCKGPFSRTMGTSENRIVAIFKEESIFVIPVPPIQPFPLRGEDYEPPFGPPYFIYWSMIEAE